jgi:hypothetical protein
MSLKLSGEITAIATAALAEFALAAAIVATLTFRRQAEEVKGSDQSAGNQPDPQESH